MAEIKHTFNDLGYEVNIFKQPVPLVSKLVEIYKGICQICQNKKKLIVVTDKIFLEKNYLQLKMRSELWGRYELMKRNLYFYDPAEESPEEEIDGIKQVDLTVDPITLRQFFMAGIED